MSTELSLATSDSELVRPLLDGRVRVEGFEVLASVCSPSEIFYRQLHYGGFDIAGKRFAVVEFGQASMVWTRGILEHDFDVAQRSVTWFVERSDDVSYVSA